MLHWCYNSKRYIINVDSAILTNSDIGPWSRGVQPTHMRDILTRHPAEGPCPGEESRVAQTNMSRESHLVVLPPSSRLPVAPRLISVRLACSSQIPSFIAEVITASVGRVLQLGNRRPLARGNRIAGCDDLLERLISARGFF